MGQYLRDDVPYVCLISFSYVDDSKTPKEQNKVTSNVNNMDANEYIHT